jgi:hypothetical protein
MAVKSRTKNSVVFNLHKKLLQQALFVVFYRVQLGLVVADFVV